MTRDVIRNDSNIIIVVVAAYCVSETMLSILYALSDLFSQLYEITIQFCDTEETEAWIV